jgi:hypothetical protein
VNVTDWPLFWGFLLLVTEIAVAALFTAWLRVAEVEPAKAVSPEYVAVTERAPVVANDVAHVATPEALTGRVPHPVIVAPPAAKVTEPVGVPEPAVTVAV